MQCVPAVLRGKIYVDMTLGAWAGCGARVLRLGVVALVVRPGDVAPALMFAFVGLDGGLAEDAPLERLCSSWVGRLDPSSMGFFWQP